MILSFKKRRKAIYTVFATTMLHEIKTNVDE